MSDTPGRCYALPAPRPRPPDRAAAPPRLDQRAHRQAVGMSESGVRRALERIAMGLFGEGMTGD